MVGKSGHISDTLLTKARALGIANLRPPDVNVEEWNRGKGKCSDCARLKQSRLDIILTVRNNGRSGEGRSRSPSSAPKDYFEYRKGLAEILLAYEPRLLVVENEEDNAGSYFDGTRHGHWDTLDDGKDTVERYAEQLAAACQVAHKLDYRCANGGLSAHAAALLTWADYVKLGRTDAACDFAKRAFYTRWSATEGERFCKVTSLDTIPSEPRKELANYKRLIDMYRRSKIDFMNFHWYGRDAKAFGEVVKYLKKATGKSVISNEIGLNTWDESVESVREHLALIDKLNLPIAVWQSSTGGNSATFLDDDGDSRPLGMELGRYLRARK